jgi:general stress protein YciG
MDTRPSTEITGDVAEEQEKSAEKPRGFAAMTPERQRELARLGGRAAHARGTAHEFSREEARVAGRRGGDAVAKDREYMSKIGREGARKSAEVRRRRPKEETKAAAPSVPPTA